MSSQTSPSTPTASGAGARLLSLTGLDAGHFAVLARHPDDMTRKTGMLNPFRTALLLVEKDAAKIEQLVPNMDKAPSDVEIRCVFTPRYTHQRSAVLEQIASRSVPVDGSWKGFVEGCKKVGATLEKFQSYDEHSISQLVYIDIMTPAERVPVQDRLSLCSDEASALGALLRFSLGNTLGHLNERMDALSKEGVEAMVAGSAIRKAQYHAAGRWLPKDGEDRTEILKGRDLVLKSNEPRFTGSGRLLYEQVQTYFDLEALFLPEEPDAAMLARSPALRAAVDALRAVYDEQGFITPIDVDKKLPGYPYHTPLAVIRADDSRDGESDLDDMDDG
ncbi:hypothetical protein A1Q1_05939 [Trichosporon asahii var. asahii CBS 2479]|uniref:Uncharacterized protein n=1 Tax=Trichosporon asahii var. asahii (strain ATCC 90039 / CBS 2479 / JCM 2466 / KCTC 7840 / NBRC 103889/ NCYC 2677 / UAMH 7654) TaxID=1186058 RepID=J6ESA4_TRIAS|nr:hypothetical protein A1Q1_05939 [Trichosporon asahii var. asahii CBS 2479]EJT45602.1 hypothetical protein A1Q1_05939 [Trichosporon asahii var. asahii CBS 2479]